MRRAMLAAIVLAAMAIPATGSAEACPSLNGRGTLDWGTTMTGALQLNYDGAHIIVPMTETAFPPEFDLTFPGGAVVHIVEHATVTPIGGSTVRFDSTLEVTSGGSTSGLSWSGVSNSSAGFAHIQSVSGDLCIDS